jgi:two-component system chemotaxis response regulator CheY
VLRVLIADDSKMMRIMHARSLRQAGYEVEILEAGSGEEALELFEPGTLDLVIVDWNMPGMDGVEFARAARERERASGKRRAPFLMITSQSTDEQMHRAKDAGIDTLLTKPVTPEALAAALDMLLAARA